MISKEFRISLDIKRSVSNREIEVVEGDTGNVFVIDLRDDGKPVDLSDSRVLAIFSHSKGTSSQDSEHEDGGVITGGESNSAVTISLHTPSFSYGFVECELQIYSGESNRELVTSAKFNFKCRRSILNSDTILSTAEYPLLSGLIAEVEGIKNDVGAAALEKITENGGAGSGIDSDMLDGLHAQAFAERGHSHAELDETVPISRGGTGAQTAEDARASLGLGGAATENILPLNKGGTGSASGGGAFGNLCVRGTLTTQSANINAYYTAEHNGVYSVTSKPPGAPLDAGILIVCAAQNTAAQIFIAYGGEIQMRAAQSSGVFDAWKRIYNSSSITYGTSDPSGGVSGNIYIKYS